MLAGMKELQNREYVEPKNLSDPCVIAGTKGSGGDLIAEISGEFLDGLDLRVHRLTARDLLQRPYRHAAACGHLRPPVFRGP